MIRKVILITIGSLTGLLSVALIIGFFIYNHQSDIYLEEAMSYADEICALPKLNINDSEILKFIEHQPPIKCSNESDWIQIEGSVVKITEETNKKHGDVECEFFSVIRFNDSYNFLGKNTTTHTKYVLEESDFFRVYCQAESGEKWEHRMAGIRMDKNIHERAGWEHVPEKGLKLNVLIFGFDSLSRMMFMRKLPKTYNKLLSLNAIVLEGYNIVGDGTIRALLPILTGKTQWELPNTSKSKGSEAFYVDVYPLIWNDFKKFGYVTAFMEDMPTYGLFTKEFRGFQSQPTDHLMRTWYVDTDEYFPNNTPFCFGSLPKHKVMLDYVKNFYLVYPNKPKFIFGFLSDLSHHFINLIEAADDDVVEWIEWFENKGFLNNTLLIMMSDHGQRLLHDVRNTRQGKLEERLPFFSFRFPAWFKYKYPKAYKNFRGNAHRLTTPFDIYKTLKSVLNFENAGTCTSISKDRAISLFKKVPKQRSCSEAEIRPHWCACATWRPINFKSKIIKKMAKDFVNFINSYNYQYSDLCEELHLDKIYSADKLLPIKEEFNSTGEIPITSVVYQVKVGTQPGNALFEFSSIYDRTEDRSIFQINDISRINRFGDDSYCIDDIHPQLQKYCYCKNR